MQRKSEVCPNLTELSAAIKLLEINKTLNFITEQDIASALKTKQNQRVVDLQDEEEWFKAARTLNLYIKLRNSSRLHATPKAPVTNSNQYSVEHDTNNSDKIISEYNKYTDKMRGSSAYINLTQDEKAKFDNIFKAKTRIVGDRIITRLVFKNKADANIFFENLRKQGYKFVILTAKESKEFDEIFNQTEESSSRFTSPSRRR